MSQNITNPIENNNPFPKIIFEDAQNLDEFEMWDMRNRGYCNYATVLLQNNLKYKVYFYAPVRLAQELEEGGASFIAEVGLIVVPEVTLEYMQAAVNKLEKQGFFNHFVPC